MTETITVEEITVAPAKKRNWKRIAIITTVSAVSAAALVYAIRKSSDDCEVEETFETTDSSETL